MERSEAYMLVIQNNKYTQMFKKFACGARQQDAFLLRKHQILSLQRIVTVLRCAGQLK